MHLKISVNRFLGYLFHSALLLSFLFPGRAEAQSARSAVDILDGILSGMSGEPTAAEQIGFDTLIDAMENGNSKSAAKKSGEGAIDFDLIFGSMDSEEAIFSGIGDSMVIGNTLDFLTNVFSGSPDYLSSYSGLYPSNPVPVFKGFAMLPIRGIMTSKFGFRPKFNRMHKGVDIALHIGDTVRAAIDGTVARVNFEAKGYGNYVVLSHSDGMETRYAHLSRSLVSPGEYVHAGQPVGLGGNTGNSTGPHLHFETRRNGEAFDPTLMFDFSMPAGTIYNRNLASLDSQNPKHAINATEEMRGKSTYVVKQGDTLESVAKKAGISLLTLCRLNMLSSYDPISPGRMLRLR